MVTSRIKSTILTISPEIFESGFLAPHPSLAFGHFEVRVDVNAPQIEDQVTYLYKSALITISPSLITNEWKPQL